VTPGRITVQRRYKSEKAAVGAVSEHVTPDSDAVAKFDIVALDADALEISEIRRMAYPPKLLASANTARKNITGKIF
jgi:hypothetical protein